MLPVRIESHQAHVGAVTLPFERVKLRLIWRLDDRNEAGPGGHAYALDAGEGTIDIVGLQHEVVEKDGMLALLAAIDERLDAVPERNNTSWPAPGDEASIYGDLGTLSELLYYRRLRLLDAATGDVPNTWRLPHESFLRAPVASWARHLLDVDWPRRWDASVLRGTFRAARRADRVVFTGCRYGSIHANNGQDRTAAVFLSEDGADTWTELPWRLSRRQALSSSGRHCWPPEQLLAIHLEHSLAVDWEDPWIDWDPGDEWRATWHGEIWQMQKRTGIWIWF